MVTVVEGSSGVTDDRQGARGAGRVRRCSIQGRRDRKLGGWHPLPDHDVLGSTLSRRQPLRPRRPALVRVLAPPISPLATLKSCNQGMTELDQVRTRAPRQRCVQGLQEYTVVAAARLHAPHRGIFDRCLDGNWMGIGAAEREKGLLPAPQAQDVGYQSILSLSPDDRVRIPSSILWPGPAKKCGWIDCRCRVSATGARRKSTDCRRADLPRARRCRSQDARSTAVRRTTTARNAASTEYWRFGPAEATTGTPALGRQRGSAT